MALAGREGRNRYSVERRETPPSHGKEIPGFSPLGFGPQGKLEEGGGRKEIG